MLRFKSSIKKDASSIFYSGLNECKPIGRLSKIINLKKNGNNKTIEISRKKFLLHPQGRVVVIGAGKASSQMAQTLENKIKEVIDCGIVITPYKYKTNCEKIEVVEASHPLPDKNGLNHTKTIMNLIEKCSKYDLVVFLLSGGASSLLIKPAVGIELKEKSWVIERLLEAGATINELNCVRKHLSAIKGGQLALKTFPSRLITLYISDVIGNKLEVIGSGPTYGDSTTFQDAQKILIKKNIWDISPKSIKQHIEMGLAGRIHDTPSPREVQKKKTYYFMVSDLNIALSASMKKAKTLAYKTRILANNLQGEAKKVGVYLAKIAKDEREKKTGPSCIICGGETTVTVKGNGKGGRCQEIALAFAREISGIPKIVLLSSGTDGRDGPTNSSGAIVNGRTVNSKTHFIDSKEALRNNNSNIFLGSRKSLFKTGPTGTNVMDIMVLIIR
ncbi:MAG: DUF4147 domain-containing protein [Nitrospinota bacterium]|nr:DUF4147 domain-containing protein [Nitrospinota bacterium]